MTDVLPDFEETTVETPTDDSPSADTPLVMGDSEYRCETCGTPLTYAGRGRKPKYCDEHKKGAAKRSAVSTSGGARWKQPLADALCAQFVMVGVGVMPFNQFDGVTIMNGSPQLAASLVNVAEHNPKVRKALETMVTAGAWAGVATAVAAIAIPILQNHNMIPALPFPVMGVG